MASEPLPEWLGDGELPPLANWFSYIAHAIKEMTRMSSDFIVLTGASGAPALLRVSAIISVVQNAEYPDRRVIEYTAADKLRTLFVKDTVDDIKWELAEDVGKVD